VKVVIGSDHGGYELKEDLKAFLDKEGYVVLDYGTYSAEPVDYPDIALLVAKKVSEDKDCLGIIIDGAGIGSAMAANKVPGVRAASCYDIYTARNSREHNDANVLTLGGRVSGKGLAQEIVKVWLNSNFLGDRHARRVDKIMQIERKYFKGE
jgi:ribose 5-phosphate isomerase B